MLDVLATNLYSLGIPGNEYRKGNRDFTENQNNLASHESIRCFMRPIASIDFSSPFTTFIHFIKWNGCMPETSGYIITSPFEHYSSEFPVP